MQTLSDHEKQIIAKIRQFSPAQIAAIEDFIDFLGQRYQDRSLVTAATRASEPAFAQVWDNAEDAAYDDPSEKVAVSTDGIRQHGAFLNGYVAADEGLYDDDPIDKLLPESLKEIKFMSPLLQDMLIKAEQLAPEERLELIQKVVASLQKTAADTTSKPKWRDLRGMAPHPLMGEDAQIWVSRTRSEGDTRQARYSNNSHEDR